MTNKRTIEKIRYSILKSINDSLDKESINHADIDEKILYLKNLEYVEQKYFPKKNNRVIFSLVFGIICLTTISLIWATPIKKVNISLHLKATKIGLQLEDGLVIKDINNLGHFYVNGLNKISTNNFGLNYRRDTLNGEEPATLFLYGNGISIRSLNYQKETELDLNINGSKLIFDSKNSNVEGALHIQSCNASLETEEEYLQVKNDKKESDMLYFLTQNSKMTPVKIDIVLNNNKIQLDNISTNKLNFEEEYPEGSGKFRSAIQSGTIRIKEVNAEKSISKYEQIVLEGIQTKYLEIIPNDGIFEITFKGLVSSIKVGQKGFLQNLTPSYLEYLYHQKRFSFFWSTLVFLWGFLWSIKKLFDL